MFQMVSDETSQQLGIGIHKKRKFLIETFWFAGSATHDSTTACFDVFIEPNYKSLNDIEHKESPSAEELDLIRSHGISLGSYRTLDVVDAAITALQHWYKDVLIKNGASHRFLIEEGNSYHLVQDDKASDLKYGEAIIMARNVQAFNMMQENKDLSYEVVVGKIMPIFLQALGLKEYHLTHDLSKEANGEVKFIIDKVGIFAFYKPQTEGKPAYFERFTHTNGNYHRTFAGETKGDILKKFVFEWLFAAAKELNTILREDHEQHLDELSKDVRRTWLSATKEKPKFLIPAQPIAQPETNVVTMARYRDYAAYDM